MNILKLAACTLTLSNLVFADVPYRLDLGYSPISSRSNYRDIARTAAPATLVIPEANENNITSPTLRNLFAMLNDVADGLPTEMVQEELQGSLSIFSGPAIELPQLSNDTNNNFGSMSHFSRSPVSPFPSMK